MRKKNFYMPIFFDDWVGGTYAMSSAARGVYIMLVIALAKGDRVAANICSLRRIGGELDEEQYEEVVGKCRVVDGFLVNDKVNRVMEVIRSKQYAGRKSNESRNGTQEDKNVISTQCSTHTQHNAQHNAQHNEGILNPNILKPKSLKPKSLKRNIGEISWNEKWTGITDEDYSLWSFAYPKVDIPGELVRMGVWIEANPKKGNKHNWKRFITNWLSRTQQSNAVARVARPLESNF